MHLTLQYQKNQGRKFLADTTHAPTVLLVVPIHVQTAAIEVQVVRVVRIVRNRRPIAPVLTRVVQRTGRIVVAVTDSGKLQNRTRSKQAFTLSRTRDASHCNIKKIRVVNSWRTQRTLSPFRLSLLLFTFKSLLLKFI